MRLSLAIPIIRLWGLCLRVLIISGRPFRLSPPSLTPTGDGVLDNEDNSPNDANPSQADLDDDGLGNVCDDDVDGDGMSNGTDPDDDNDGLNDVDEVGGLDPLDPDSDDDGYRRCARCRTRQSQ